MKRIRAHLTGSLQGSISAYRKNAGTLKSTVRMHGDKSLHIGIGGNDMTIAEPIEKHKKLKISAEMNNDKRGAFYSGEEHKQIAEWLEELKAIKSDGFTDNLINMWFTKGYSKALNDVESEFLMCDKVHYNLQDILCVINKLKAGGENGTDNK